QGRFRIGPLRAGRYVVSVQAEGTGMLKCEPFTLEPRATKDVGTLLLERGGRIHATLRPPAGVPLSRYIQSYVLANGRAVAFLHTAGTSGGSRVCQPATYVVHTRQNEWYAPDKTVDVRAGATVEVELVLQPATTRTLAFVAPAGETVQSVHALVRDER